MSRERLKEMIERAQRAAIFTGAGISTDPGFPTSAAPAASGAG